MEDSARFGAVDQTRSAAPLSFVMRCMAPKRKCGGRVYASAKDGVQATGRVLDAFEDMDSGRVGVWCRECKAVTEYRIRSAA